MALERDNTFNQNAVRKADALFIESDGWPLSKKSAYITNQRKYIKRIIFFIS